MVIQDTKPCHGECCICMEETPLVLLKCGHTFCSDCLHKTVENHFDCKMVCPMCRDISYQTSDLHLNHRILLTELLRNPYTGYCPGLVSVKYFQKGSRWGTVYWDNDFPMATQYYFWWRGPRARKSIGFKAHYSKKTHNVRGHTNKHYKGFGGRN